MLLIITMKGVNWTLSEKDLLINYLNETNEENETIIGCYYTNNDSLSFLSINNFILPTIIISIILPTKLQRKHLIKY